MASLTELFGDAATAVAPASTPAPARARGPKLLTIPFAPPAAQPVEPTVQVPTVQKEQEGQEWTRHQPVLRALSETEAKSLLQAGAPQAEPTVQDLVDAFPYGYLAGAAGTGKTTLARALADRDDTLLCATTGIAAVNLGPSVVTINATLGYFDTESLMEAFAEGRLQMRLRGLLRMGIRRLVLDEVSMLDATQLAILLQALDEVAKTAAYDQALEQVVTGERTDRRMGLLLVGDFAQLPPVKAPFAFTADCWPEFAAHTHTLTTIRRQGDAAYVAALQAVRRGDPQAALPVLTPRFTDRLDLTGFQGTTLVAKNDEVDRINLLRHGALPGTPLQHKTIRSGEQQKEWLSHIPEVCSVKPGALVMILANAYDDVGLGEHRALLYANGDTGEVVEPGNGIKVKLTRTGEVVDVGPVTREWKEPYTETETEKTARKARAEALKIPIPKPKYRIRGSVSYLPLRLAYATTVHKCVAGHTRLPIHGLGYQPIADVRIGSTTPYGAIKAVTRSEQPAYRILTARGYSLITSADHEWVTRDGLVATQDFTATTAIKLSAGPPFPGWDSLEVDAWWWLGLTVGDGCYSDKTGGQIHLACMDQSLGDEYKQVGEQAWGPTIAWRKDRRGLYLTSVSLRKRLETMGLEYVTGRYKRIPSLVWLQGPERRAAFLQGLFDADGSCGRNRVVLTTASEKMGEDVQELLLTLGIISKRTGYVSGYKQRGDKYYQIGVGAESLDTFKNTVGFRQADKLGKLERVRPNRTLNPTLTYDQVVHVEPVGLTLPMYDVEIEAPHLLTFGPFMGSNSQGLSLDRVQIGLASWMFGQPGMTYVALSRCRTLAGLTIVGSPKMFLGKCSVDPRVRPYL